MRTIEFRGRHLCGQWYYGNLIVREKYSPVPETAQAYKCVMIGDVEDGSAEEVEEETVGQYTGLVDKNGKKIYEGDIIKSKGNFVGIVTWNSKSYFYINQYYNSDIDQEPDCSSLGYMLTVTELYVIGNVYDNEDLLKKE